VRPEFLFEAASQGWPGTHQVDGFSIEVVPGVGG
jgi:hypothetical protein